MPTQRVRRINGMCAWRICCCAAFTCSFRRTTESGHVAHAHAAIASVNRTDYVASGQKIGNVILPFE
jgi:hypothetical protein